MGVRVRVPVTVDVRPRAGGGFEARVDIGRCELIAGSATRERAIALVEQHAAAALGRFLKAS